MMSMKVRRLNNNGIDRFREYLADLRSDNTLPVPEYLLDNKETSVKIAGAPAVDRPGFATKRDAANFLVPRLESLDSPDTMNDSGLWNWLALYYFDDLCPPNSDGKRKPVADPHYILDPYNSKRRYRHLLATPYLIAKAMPDYNRIFLNAVLSKHGDLVEQTMGRLYLIRLPAIREAIDRLYFDESEGKAKRGILPKKEKKGDLRNRLPIRIRQLRQTFDIAGLNCDQLLDLLGEEFQGWLGAA